MENKFYKITTLLLILVCIVVIFMPNLYLTSVQKTILFLLAAFIPALLFTKELDVKFNLSLPIFSITATGTSGLLLAILFSLSHLTDKGPYITIYEFTYENGNPVQGLNRYSTFEIKPGADGTVPATCISNNKVFLVYNKESDIAIVDYRLLPFHDIKSMELRYNPKINVTEIMK